MSVAVQQHEGRTVITVSGRLDTEAASNLVSLLKRAASAQPAAPVVIDVGFARQITAVALAVLSGVEQQVWNLLRFRGLSQHDERILQHLRAEHG
jgi:anti-anti-sigma regulatory factor